MKISRAWVGLGAVVVAVGVGGVAWRHHAAVAPAGWSGKVSRIVTGGGSDHLGGTNALGEGGLVAAGSTVATDRRQRARLEMSDGTVLVLDRDTEIAFGAAPGERVLHVHHGVVRADVAHVEGSSPAKLVTARGDVTVLGTDLTVTATDDSTDVQVSRGSVHARTTQGRDVEVEAGQEALLTATDVELGLAATSRGDLLDEAPTAKASSGGVGELRARRPGHAEEGDKPLRIASHAVKVRIAGAMARTEIEETFSNETDNDLEGIYRFPVPSNALVDRLALDVDDKLVDGSFVEKNRAAKILKGAIANASPHENMQDIVWVPGPWRDPALLDWQQGGRFELRIFPIPKHGSRHVVIGYTQTVASSLGMRRYTYPLPSVGAVRMEDFSVDLQVLGADDGVPLRTRGYDLTGDGQHLALHEKQFTPTGDLTVEYALPSRGSEMSAWTYDSGTDGRFAAFALRPRLPANAEAAPRDWVVVVDSGRTMFGERFARAKEVASALARTLDRRDRMEVMACDVTCKASPDGFVAPGMVAAKATDDFLVGVVPESASDLVAAVRAASNVTHDRGRELRVVLVSDGLATAGYKRAARVAEETRDGLSSGTAVLTVPVGGDGDEAVLEEIARGGGGVMVPYAPGESVDNVAFALAGAGAGSMLRDAEVVLPEGLEATAPAVLPTLRVGSETFVVAKMTAPQVRGDVVLRSGSFEARYPVVLGASAEPGNAFVPRLYAALRMRDLERQPTDTARKEAITLSQRYAVPSRYTSLLVLESEAMFKAFGVDRKTVAPRWTGEEAADGSEVMSLGHEQAPADLAASSELAINDLAMDKASALGGGAAGPMLPRAVATTAAPTASLAHMAMRRRPLGRFMRRVSHREATIAPADAWAEGSADSVSKARAAVAGAPDDRGKVRTLARALLRDGANEELTQLLGVWQSRDPLDVEALTLRADALAEKGMREAAGRVAMSVAGFVDAPRIDELARGVESQGDADAGCALRVAAAETTPDDAKRVARAIRCERARGRDASANRWLGEPGTRRTAIEAALAKEETTTQGGDIVLDASWEGNEDVDLALIDPNGQRLGWLDGRARVTDPTSRAHERLAVTSKPNGRYVVEVVRTTSSRARLRGTVTVSAFGSTRRVPFDLDGGTSTRVASVDARVVTELVPVDDWGDTGTFVPATALTQLNAVSLAGCGVDGHVGPGSAAVTFQPWGTVSSVVLAPPFAGTAAGACVANKLRAVKLDAVSNGPHTVTTTFVVPPSNP